MSMDTVRDRLAGRVGQEGPPGAWIAVDQHRIDRFAEATGDFQWIHVDPERARRESPYGRTIAHGFLTLSLLPALLRETEGGATDHEGVKLAVNYGLNRVRFPAPVPVDARVRARVKLLDISEVSGGLQLTREITIETEGQDKPCCVAESLVRLYF